MFRGSGFRVQGLGFRVQGSGALMLGCVGSGCVRLCRVSWPRTFKAVGLLGHLGLNIPMRSCVHVFVVPYSNFRSLAFFGFIGFLNKAATKFMATLLSAAKIWPVL